MYHVQITSSALPKFPEDEEFDRIHPNVTYQLGIPRKDALGRTERDEANNNLVSPSFMIASRLGFISGDLPEDDDEVAYKQAASHCANYVEVYYPRDEKGRRLKDASGRELEPVVLDDWRLPTKAELLIIMLLSRNFRSRNRSNGIFIKCSRIYECGRFCCKSSLYVYRQCYPLCSGSLRE